MPNDSITPPEETTPYKSLRRKRGNIQASITNFTKTINEWKTNLENRDPDYLQVALERVERNFEKFDSLQDQLEEIDETEAAKREEFETMFNLAVSQARKLLREVNGTVSNAASGSSTPISQNTATYAAPISVTLPQITLPKFDGSVEGWASFYDIFSSLIDRNENLPPVRKLQYLRLSLTGRAASAIESLETTDQNYEIALTILRKKFECVRRTLQRHWNILRDYPRLAKDTPAAINNLLDTIYQHTRAAENLGAPVNQWDIPLIELILSKINQNTAWQWELTLQNNSMPSYKDLLEFLEKRASCSDFTFQYDSRNHNKTNNQPQYEQRNRTIKPPVSRERVLAISNSPQCSICMGDHKIYTCQQFRDLSLDEKQKAVIQASLCFNCLGYGHNYKNCRAGPCHICKARHHTILHKPTTHYSTLEMPQPSTSSSATNSTPSTQSRIANKTKSIQNPSGMTFILNSATSEIMASVVVNAVDQRNQLIQCRGLLDTCSTTNLMTERLANILGVKKVAHSIPIGAVNGLTTFTKHSVTVKIKSRINNYSRTLTFLTVPEITQMVPRKPITRSQINIPQNLKLADPNFYRPAPIDLLINAGTAFSLLSVGQVNLSPAEGPDLYLQKTRLGWIIGGSPPVNKPMINHVCHVTNDLQFDLTRFWEIEEGFPTDTYTDEERRCQEHFNRFTTRDKEGRYIVALPFNERISNLGESKLMALNRLKNLERRLDRNIDLKQQYNAILREYLSLGHMSAVEETASTQEGYYLPHHAILKQSSLTTKVRVVFDGSAKSSSNISLNDTLLVGPTIQSDIFSLLIRFRKYVIVLSGDIEKMYRQVLVRPEDRKFQRILWRNGTGQLQTYELNTVTFGLSSAPYLAIQTIQRLATEDGHYFPRAARALKQDFYVDDALTGASTKEEAIVLRKELTELLKRGGFSIRQWASNDPDVLEEIPEDSINLHLTLGDSMTLKTLGIFWNSSTDCIIYTVKTTDRPTKLTKRFILSETAKIFDPLGLVAPVIITAKILMQRLWSLKLDWDESLPASIHTEWTNYYTQLQSLNNLSFKRSVTTNEARDIQLHGFCDASEKAYGACIYIRTISTDGNVQVELLCAKSRVAPLKSISIPRLELCGALLLSNLYAAVKTEIQLNINATFFWTDSTIVLNWLQASPHQLKTFVANRISEIQRVTNVSDWYHVRTNDNPADLVSRGLSPVEFIRPSIWKHGPLWLSQKKKHWPVLELPSVTDLLERKANICLATTLTTEFNLLTRYSSFSKLKRIIAYCLRFGRKSLNKGFLSVSELHQSLQVILRLTQQQAFSEELKNLRKGRPISPTSKLIRLNPFLDGEQILRVGGRLHHSSLPFTAKHPVILPKNHHITELIIQEEHRNHLHAGTQATLYAVRRRYWPLDGRSQVWKVIKPCIRCTKAKPPSTEYIMGILPKARVNETRPFTHVGVDYCGPFLLKERKYRNRKTIKVYVAVFVCLSIKAVHLEIVSDLTSDGFIAALRRFIGRRGLCTHIYSDNGTNFVGANNELRVISEALRKNDIKGKINEYFISKGIEWHFIPPQSPDFGGLWEAAVKSFKYHLRRVAGADLLFTFEEFNTLVIDIEAILNSRPLTPISSDPNDPIVLTPGHFLIGDSLTNLHDYNYCHIASNRLSTWQHIQKVKQDFWKRWRYDYLNELTIRSKWTHGCSTITKGTLVLLKDDNLPPLQWAMGRVMECLPGPDGIVRTVIVRTANTTFKRNIRKLAPLPIETTEEKSTISHAMEKQ